MKKILYIILVILILFCVAISNVACSINVEAPNDSTIGENNSRLPSTNSTTKNEFEGDIIAKIGEYELTEKALKKYAFIVFIKTGKCSLTTAADEYAKAKITLDEISGSDFDIPEGKREELLKIERENFNRDYEDNIEICNKNGLTQEELIDIVVTSKIDITASGNHLSMFIRNYKEDKHYSAEEWLALYDEYVLEKIQDLEFESIDKDALSELEIAISNFNMRD